jgi:hypothetical protein
MPLATATPASCMPFGPLVLIIPYSYRAMAGRAAEKKSGRPLHLRERPSGRPRRLTVWWQSRTENPQRAYLPSDHRFTEGMSAQNRERNPE